MPERRDPNHDDPNLSRRGALIRMLEIGLGVAGAAVLTSGSSEPVAEARTRPAPPIAAQPRLVSIHVETPDGGEFPSFRHGGELWVAGHEGQRYDLRLQNHSPERVEVVVSVDGRDVISGQLGDYVKQRGYVLDPFESLVIEGYRQSLDSVAAFRFADLADSYSAQLGTPVHVGLIGAAVFTERRPARRRQAPLAPIEGHPFPGEDAPRAAPSVVGLESDKPSRRSKGGLGSAAAGEASWAGPRDEPAHAEADDEGHGGWARPSQLGTEYGESTFSPVEEVSFKRRHKRKPDEIVVLHYDSLAGLQARGIVDAPPPRPQPRWQPEPPRPGQDPRFAPPPPPRDWWR